MAQRLLSQFLFAALILWGGSFSVLHVHRGPTPYRSPASRGFDGGKLIGWVGAADSGFRIDMTLQTAGPVRVNRSFFEGPLIVAGKTYERGLGTAAHSRIRLELGPTSRLTGLCGVDDGGHPDGEALNFRVLSEGIPIFESGWMKRGMEPKPFSIPTKSLRYLDLMVEMESREGRAYSGGDWLDIKAR